MFLIIRRYIAGGSYRLEHTMAIWTDIKVVLTYI